MRILIAFFLIIHFSALSADSLIIPYKLNLDESFLMGNDSVILVIHNGQFLEKIKLKRGENLEVDMQYFIPCFSGRTMSSEERTSEILEWNGTTYNFYYERTRLMVSVPVITTDFYANKIRRDSTYQLTLDTVEPNDFEQAQFRRLYYEFMTSYALIQSKGIKAVLENDDNRYNNIAYKFIDQIRFRYFTTIELEAMLRTKLPVTGLVKYDRYYDGRVVGAVRISTSNGYVTSVRH